MHLVSAFVSISFHSFTFHWLLHHCTGTYLIYRGLLCSSTNRCHQLRGKWRWDQGKFNLRRYSSHCWWAQQRVWNTRWLAWLHGWKQWLVSKLSDNHIWNHNVHFYILHTRRLLSRLLRFQASFQSLRSMLNSLLYSYLLYEKRCVVTFSTCESLQIVRICTCCRLIRIEFSHIALFQWPHITSSKVRVACGSLIRLGVSRLMRALKSCQ